MEAWQLAAGNALNMEDYCRREGIACQMELVANGPAVKLFVPAQAELQKTAEELMARGLKLHLCKNALDANKMTAADLWPGCEVVPAGLVDIVELQNKGFAYIRP